jgi:hypothetical protein
MLPITAALMAAPFALQRGRIVRRGVGRYYTLLQLVLERVGSFSGAPEIEASPPI